MRTDDEATTLDGGDVGTTAGADEAEDIGLLRSIGRGRGRGHLDGNGDGDCDEASSLSRQLTAWDGVACNVSNMVGSGIFSSPGVIIMYAGSVGLGLIAWILGAALAAGSAMCYAELSTMMPNAGGDYAYLRAAFGAETAFAWSWSMFTVIKSGSLAILGVTFAAYTLACFGGGGGGGDSDTGDSGSGSGSSSGGSSFEVRALAMGLIVMLTWVNAAGGVGRGARIQNALLCIKFALMIAVVLVAVAFAVKHPALAAHRLVGGGGGGGGVGGGGGGGDGGGGGGVGGFSGSKLGGLASATVASLWAFDGFNNVVYMAEELREPRRDLPNAIGLGLFIVLVGYLAVNVGYVTAMGPDRVAGSMLIVLEMARDAAGETAAKIAAGAVALSVAGAANASTMSGGRFLYATARDGQAPPVLAAVHPVSRAPHVALWTQAAWSCALLAVPGVDFVALLGYFGAASWLFYSLTSAAVSVLRRTKPNARRPYTVPLGDNVVPVLTAVVGLALVVDLTRANPTPCVMALGFCALSVPVYRYTKTRGWPGQTAGDRGGGGEDEEEEEEEEDEEEEEEEEDDDEEGAVPVDSGVNRTAHTSL